MESAHDPFLHLPVEFGALEMSTVVERPGGAGIDEREVALRVHNTLQQYRKRLVSVAMGGCGYGVSWRGNINV